MVSGSNVSHFNSAEEKSLNRQQIYETAVTMIDDAVEEMKKDLKNRLQKLLQ